MEDRRLWELHGTTKVVGYRVAIFLGPCCPLQVLGEEWMHPLSDHIPTVQKSITVWMFLRIEVSLKKDRNVQKCKHFNKIVARYRCSQLLIMFPDDFPI